MIEEIAISASDLSKSYGRKKALDGTSIDIRSGKIHVLLGRNGSGKTTLVKILAGILDPDSGRVSRDSSFRRQTGFLFDSSSHWDALTGHENAWFFARAYGLDKHAADERIRTLFKELALEEVGDDRVSSYSFGMRRKLALVEALAHDPSLIVLDEPSIGLDFASRTSLYSLLRKRADDGKAVVIATNDMNEAMHLADTVSLMESGRVLATGAPDDLVKSLGQEIMMRALVKAWPPLDRIRSVPGVVDASVLETKDGLSLSVMVKLDQEEAAVVEIMKSLASRSVGISRLDIRRPDLGDVFLRFAEGGVSEA